MVLIIIFNLKLYNVIIEEDEFENKNITYFISKDKNEEYKDAQEYIYMVFNGTLYNPNKILKKSHKPKISITMAVYNAEGYLRTALLSIQNQDFKDIEIIMVDDCSLDNTISLIKELMKEDPRITFYQNTENRGTLYTKTKAISYAKGKYVMILDQDDIFVQKDAFLTLYLEAEKNNLDILGFASILSAPQLKMGQYVHRYIETPIIYQPDVPKRMYDYIGGNVKRVGDVLWNYIYKMNYLLKLLNKLMKNF